MQHDRPIHARRLRIEPLEDRRMLATIVVDSLQDNTTADGSITLREAILAANNDTIADAVEGVQAGNGADVIEFDPALFADGPRTILLTKGELSVTRELTINGPGAELLTIDASGNDPTQEKDNGVGSRILNVDDGDSNTNFDFAIRKLSLTGSDLSPLYAGAIHLRENGILDSLRIHDNSAGSASLFTSSGAALVAQGGAVRTQVKVVDSTVEKNRANGDGGAIYASRVDLIVERSVFRENRSRRGNFGGGAIYIRAGSLEVDSSMFAGNDSYANGGAVQAISVDARIENSTFGMFVDEADEVLPIKQRDVESSEDELALDLALAEWLAF